MEGKANVMAVMMVLILFGGQYLTCRVKANVAAVEKEFCLSSCTKSCRTSGISPLRCFKYCERHCGSPASSGRKSPTQHFCKLGCMLDECAKFNEDEGKQESCVANCEIRVCLVG